MTPAAAEDLLQSAFLRAIEVRDEWDGRRLLLPWLCGILQNRAHHHRWQSGRAPDPSRLAARPPIDPAKAAEGSEFDAAVDAAIAGVARTVPACAAPPPRLRPRAGRDRARAGTPTRHRAQTDQAGLFFLRSVEPERFLSATIARRRSAAVLPVRGNKGQTVGIGLVMRGIGASLIGRVVGPGGVPATDARVFVG